MDDKHQEQEFLLQLYQLKNLPALPEVSMRILDAINDPEIYIDKLTATLSMSPGLVARLISLSNSAYFRQAKPINDLSTAIYQVLGLDLVKSLALSIILNVQLDASKCQAFNTKYFWHRSMLTAITAQKLSKSLDFKQYSPSVVYTCGLLLYIGILVLAFLTPAKLNGIMFRCQTQKNCISKAIRDQLGESHFKFAFILLQKWQLSATYLSVFNHFEDRNFNGEERDLIKILTVSQMISSTIADNDELDLTELTQYCEKLSLPSAGLSDIIDDLIEKRQDIELLASVLGGA